MLTRRVFGSLAATSSLFGLPALAASDGAGAHDVLAESLAKPVPAGGLSRRVEAHYARSGTGSVSIVSGSSRERRYLVSATGWVDPGSVLTIYADGVPLKEFPYPEPADEEGDKTSTVLVAEYYEARGGVATTYSADVREVGGEVRERFVSLTVQEDDR